MRHMKNESAPPTNGVCARVCVRDAVCTSIQENRQQSRSRAQSLLGDGLLFHHHEGLFFTVVLVPPHDI